MTASRSGVPQGLRPQDSHDPGGRVRLRLPDGVQGAARFSTCGRYRYEMSRDWTPDGTGARAILFVGQNPSTAEADVSDPTCNRELNYARAWGYTRYLKGNVLSWRATRPADLPHDPDLAQGPETIDALLSMAEASEMILMATGRLHPRFAGKVVEAHAALIRTGLPLMCLGINADGSPKHPLYQRKDLKPIPWSPPA